MSRPQIPMRIKREVWERDKGVCDECANEVPDFKLAEFDHRPALWSRERDYAYEEKDPRHYVPNANDPKFIFTVHGKKTPENCHGLRTNGNGLNLGDTRNAAKSKRLQEDRTEHEAKMAAKAGLGSTTNEKPKRPKFKRHWPKQKFRGWRNMKGEPVWAKDRDQRNMTSLGATMSVFGIMVFLTPSLVALLEGALRGEEDDFTRWIMSKTLGQQLLMVGCCTFGIFLTTAGLAMEVWWK